MKLLEDRIIKEGEVLGKDVLKVDSFINHQIDVRFLIRLGAEFAARYRGEHITKILTLEASGIAVAAMTALHFDVPVVFAKKMASRNIGNEVYSTEVPSFTRGNVNTVYVSKKYLKKEDRVLIIDDFLADGNSLSGMIALCDQAGAAVVGCGVLIEKVFQGGGDRVRRRCRVESLAKIASMEDGKIVFAPDASKTDL
ncbi:MAG: xanthine phosphoribosyltransferase [Clostridia bacterium]|nr:xanthine phosphoribosyltransferase [Clostridia bacterium]